MFTERLLTATVKAMAKRRLALKPTDETMMPAPEPGRTYMLYMHVPFCQVLCPYCSFNRYPYRQEVARPYFESLRKEMLMLKDLGYDFESLYVGGGTPTIMLDELCRTIDLARENFSITEVSSETNPNHLTKPYLEQLTGRVQRLSVGVQSFDDGLLKQMDRYKKYGSGEQILERIAEANGYFDSLNVDMIFNFPSQTEEILRSDLEKIAACGARQTTFSPLYASNGTVRKMASALGELDYDRERRYYHILDDYLAGGETPRFRRSTLWTFTRTGSATKTAEGYDQIDEYQTNYDDYPAIGSGSITHLNGALYVNTFSICRLQRPPLHRAACRSWARARLASTTLWTTASWSSSTSCGSTSGASSGSSAAAWSAGFRSRWPSCGSTAPSRSTTSASSPSRPRAATSWWCSIASS